MKKLLLFSLLCLAACSSPNAPVNEAPLFGVWIGSIGDTMIISSNRVEWRRERQRDYADSYSIGFTVLRSADSLHASAWSMPDTSISIIFAGNTVNLHYHHYVLSRTSGKDASPYYWQP